MSATLYATRDVNVRSGPSKDFEVIGWYSSGAKVTVTGQCNETGWYQVKYDGEVAYVSYKYVSEEKPAKKTSTSSSSSASSQSSSSSYKGISVGDVITCEATYYCACSKCCGKSDGVTTSGLKIQNGVTPSPGVIACN